MTDRQTMECSFYEDHCYTAGMNGDSTLNGDPIARSLASKRPDSSNAGLQTVTELRKSLKLDFTSPESAKKTLQTPDVLRFLQLTSPELEKFLSQGVAVVTTPTPTQFLFPKNVTAQQESYARGFIDALNALHQSQGFVPAKNLLSPGFLQHQTSSASVVSAINSTVLSTAIDSVITSTTSVSEKTVPAPLIEISAPETSNIDVVSESDSTTSIMNSVASNYCPYPGVTFCPPQPGPYTQHAKMTPHMGLKREPLDINDRPPSQALPPGSVEFTTLTQAYPRSCSASNISAISMPPQCASYSVAQQPVAQAGAASQPVQLMHFPEPSPPQTFAPMIPAQPVVAPAPTTHVNGFRVIKQEEPQTVPSVSMGSESLVDIGYHIGGDYNLPPSSSVSSVDMMDQEQRKLERKRLRNRVAATKCRQKKIERINELDSQVKACETRKKELDQSVSGLQTELAQLRALVKQHTDSGCLVASSNNYLLHS